jgi:hypothetical protein
MIISNPFGSTVLTGADARRFREQIGELPMKKIYIAGPMSGLPEFNFPAFNEAAARFRADGWIVFNPAEKDAEAGLDPEAYETGDADLATERGFDFRDAYLWDLEAVLRSNAIYMLPGWENSPGARGEHAVAVAIKRHDPSYELIYT